MKILYLYADLKGYQIPIFKEYVKRSGVEVHVIHWNYCRSNSYRLPAISGIFYYNRSNYSVKQLKEFVIKLSPQIVYISGWMDKGYLRAARLLRNRGIPIVAGFDDIWWKTLKQRIASLLFPFAKSKFFSHAWVAGPYQYEFAKRLGFKNTEIIFNCLSADTELFNSAYYRSIIKKRDCYPHRFIYVGRFEYVKGVDILVQAWNKLKTRALTKDWELCVIGNGSLYNYISKFPDIEIVDYLQPKDLANKIEKYGCFVLASRKEQWSLVIHEFSAAGFPIICSDVCGAAAIFLTNKYNGYTFRSESIEDLKNKMVNIINSTNYELVKMAEKSHLMGQKITPEMSAFNFLSILND